MSVSGDGKRDDMPPASVPLIRELAHKTKLDTLRERRRFRVWEAALVLVGLIVGMLLEHLACG